MWSAMQSHLIFCCPLIISSFFLLLQTTLEIEAGTADEETSLIELYGQQTVTETQRWPCSRYSALAIARMREMNP